MTHWASCVRDDEVRGDVRRLMDAWGYNPCTDPEHHQSLCRAANIVLVGYEVWRRTPRLTKAQREEVEHAFRESVEGQAVCVRPAAHVSHGLVRTAVLAGYAEAE